VWERERDSLGRCGTLVARGIRPACSSRKHFSKLKVCNQHRYVLLHVLGSASALGILMPKITENARQEKPLRHQACSRCCTRERMLGARIKPSPRRSSDESHRPCHTIAANKLCCEVDEMQCLNAKVCWYGRQQATGLKVQQRSVETVAREVHSVRSTVRLKTTPTIDSRQRSSWLRVSCWRDRNRDKRAG